MTKKATKTKTATFVKRIAGWRGEAALYRLDPPMATQDYDYEASKYAPGPEREYVIVSAVVAFGVEPETYIFPATSAGEAIDYGELDGSYRGGLDHAEALARAGYGVTK